jgi:uroporphyrin-III C-methyltransferase
VIPGVTAALAASAGALAPLTHRGAAQAVTFVTAHAAGGATPELDWAALAQANQTVVIYMGLTKAAEIAARLIAAGRAPSTPALIAENASLPTERRIPTTLAALGAAAAALTGPALLIVGESMALAEAEPKSDRHPGQGAPAPLSRDPGGEEAPAQAAPGSRVSPGPRPGSPGMTAFGSRARA